MREIKFRAWDTKEKQMLGVNHLFNLDNKQPIEVWTNDYEVGYRFNPDKFEIMQYTGLKDKNGKNIYEGDIVRWGGMAGLGHEKPVRVAAVRFDPDICFDSNVGIFDYGNFAYKETDKYLTVIGNIYENPDLLEADK